MPSGTRPAHSTAAAADSSVFQLSTAFEQSLPGPALPGLVTLGHFLRPSHSTKAGGRRLNGVSALAVTGLSDSPAAAAPTSSSSVYTCGGNSSNSSNQAPLSLAVCSSGQRVLIHNNNHTEFTPEEDNTEMGNDNAVAAPSLKAGIEETRRAAAEEEVEEADVMGQLNDEGDAGLTREQDEPQRRRPRSSQQHPHKEGGGKRHQGRRVTPGGGGEDHEEGGEYPSSLLTGDTKVITLSFGREPTAIAAGSGFGISSTPPPPPAGSRPRTGDDALLTGADALLLGTSQSVLAYDVLRNKEFFYKEREEDTRVLVHGKVFAGAGGSSSSSSSPPPTTTTTASKNHERLTLMGGHGAVLGVDSQGEERFWAVAGDRVTCMALIPWFEGGEGRPHSASEDPTLHVIAASEDHVIRVFRGAEVVASIVEADVVRLIVPQWTPHRRTRQTRVFAYLLENGTVGVYDGEERLWRVRGAERRAAAVSATFCDVDGDGVDELVVGWASGTVEVRSVYGSSGNDGGLTAVLAGGSCTSLPGSVGSSSLAKQQSKSSRQDQPVPALRPPSAQAQARRGAAVAPGEVLFRHTYPDTSVASLLTADYRGNGVPLPLLTTTDGKVRGLLLHPQQQSAVAAARELALLETRVQEKADLVAELESLQAQLATIESGAGRDTTMPSVETKVNVATVPNPATQKLDIQFYLSSSHPSTVISSVVLRCDPPLGGSGEDAWCFVAGDTPSSSLLCPITYDKVQPTRFHASVSVGGLHAANAQVMELLVAVPAFVMYFHLDAAVSRWGGLIPATVVQEAQRWRTRQADGGAAGRHPMNSHSGSADAGSGSGGSRPNVSLFFNEDLHYTDFPLVLRRLFAIPSTIALDSFPEDENGHAMDALYRVPIIHLLSMEVIYIEVRQPASTSAWRQVVLSGAGMEMCGDILQQIQAGLPQGFAEKNGVPVHVRYHFEAEGAALRLLLQKIYERNEARGTLSVGMADAVSALRVTLIRAEDARLLGELSAMKSAYTTVMDYNQELLDDNTKRLNNFEELKEALKEVNRYIQRAARLRLGGEERATFVNACRAALRDNHTSDLVDLIAKGIQ